MNPKQEVLNEVPVINASDRVLTEGDRFAVLEGVTATDKEDGNLTDKIQVLKNTVNKEEAGTYEVTYKVTDSQGASTIKTITVTVKDKEVKTDINKSGTDKPSKGTSSVETGDLTNISFYVSLFAMGAVCIVILVAWKKKKALRNR